MSISPFPGGKMTRLLNYVIVVGSLTAANAFSPLLANPNDGNALLQRCTAALKWMNKEKMTGDEYTLAGMCVSYVNGFMDAIPVTVTQTGGKPTFCPPSEGVETGQVIRHFVTNLRDIPEYLPQPAWMALYSTLEITFPCGK